MEGVGWAVGRWSLVVVLGRLGVWPFGNWRLAFSLRVECSFLGSYFLRRLSSLVYGVMGWRWAWLVAGGYGLEPAPGSRFSRFRVAVE